MLGVLVMMGAQGHQLWWPILSVLVAIYRFSCMESLMKGCVWVIGMMGAWDNGCSGSPNAVADWVHISGDL